MAGAGSTDGPSEVPVRPYRPSDRAALLTVAADAAFFGEPVEAFLEDRRLFCEAMYSYYLDLEPQHAWVGSVTPDAAPSVAGFLVGAIDTGRKHRLWVSRVLPTLIVRALRGRYRLGPSTRRFAWSQVRETLRAETPGVPLDVYPAHLHISVAKPWRSSGLGTSLMRAYVDQLTRLGVPGVHLQTTTRNEEAIGLYEKLGFHRLDARRTRTWAHLVPEPIWNVAYGLRLG